MRTSDSWPCGSGRDAGEVIEEALTDPGIIDRARPVSTPRHRSRPGARIPKHGDLLQAAPDRTLQRNLDGPSLADGFNTAFLR